MEQLEVLKPLVNQRAFEVYRKAFEHCEELVAKCQSAIQVFLAEQGVSPDDICVVGIGSVGRREALLASDLDIVPVLARPNILSADVDRALRARLKEVTGLKVSKGEDLTGRVALSDLVDPETIGGDRDDSASLTKRVLILTEGVQLGGDYSLAEVKDGILDAYSAERTSGRHALSLCNDVARYYRTLCIEYKAKIDVEDKDWCTRNLKLRHSRKFWYFATVLTMASLACKSPQDPQFARRLLDALDQGPAIRLANSVPESARVSAGRILESFAWFLDFMSDAANREALAQVGHPDRYSPKVGNPFPAMKYNSDVMHHEMLGLLDALDRATRVKVLDWFLL